MRVRIVQPASAKTVSVSVIPVSHSDIATVS